ncbi:dienelactone hydrolase family protein [Flaviramulus aquimarinus]
MKTFKYIILKVLCISLLFNCSKSDDDTFKNTRSLQDAINDFSLLTFNSGVNDMEIEGSFSNVYWRFRVIIPESASETNKRPLIICLHGGTSIIDPDIHKNTACLEEPGLASIDAILLCPNSEGFSWGGLPEQEKILTLTDLVKTNLPVDENKVAIMGYSDGGNGAWFYAERYPNRFSAAIPMSSSYNTLNPELINVKIDIPLYVIHGEKDELFPLETMITVVDNYKNIGTDVELYVADDLGHFNTCLYVPYLNQAATWLENEVWN